MIKLPLSKTTFKRTFLEGKGQVEISSEGDSWTALIEKGKPFTPGVGDIARLGFSVGSGQKPLKVGSQKGLAVTASATGAMDGSIRLIWPQEQDKLLDTYGLASCLTQGKLFAALTFNGNAGAEGGAKFPSGPLAATFNLGAGGHVAFTRLMLFDQKTPARTLLRELAAAPILPQNIDQTSEIPAECEVLSLRYGGYLNVGSGLNWGYSFAGLKKADVGDLDLALSYTAKAAASLSLGYKLAGEFEIEARRGHEDGWVRFVVRKARDSSFSFGADFGLDASFGLSGLPQSADDFLGALLGTDARAALGYLQQATELSDLGKLQKKLDGLAAGFLEDLAHEWIGDTLSSATAAEFFEIAENVVAAHKKIDQRIIEIYETYLDKVHELTAILDKLDQVTSRRDFEGLNDSQAWEIVERRFGDEIHDVLLDDERFEKFRDFVTEAKDFVESDAKEKVRQFVGGVKEKLGLDSLITKLEKVDSAKKLTALADQKLQGLVGRILGSKFDKIKTSNVGASVTELHDFLVKVQAFKKDFYGAFLKKVTAQSVSMSLNYKFSRATSREALFDVECNLQEAAGRKLSRAASGGDFSTVLKTYDPKVVRVNQGVMTSNFKKSRQLQINIFGWGKSNLVELMQNLEHSIESDPGGLINVYTMSTQIKRSKKSGRQFKEERQSSFLLQAVGASLQPSGSTAQNERDEFLIQTLRKLAMEYDLVHKDERTTVEELTEYLNLAEMLRLIPSREAVITQLRHEFPRGFGNVEASYVVRYDDRAVRGVFLMPNDTLQETARAATRQLIGTSYTALGPTNKHSLVGFAYLSPEFAELKRRAEVKEKGKSVRVPAWFTGGQARTEPVDAGRRLIVDTIFNIEAEFVKRLVKLDTAIDKALDQGESVPVPELQKASRDFVKMADRLNRFAPRENTFFGVFDKLVQVGNADKCRRESAMILKITPPEGESVTKYFMSPGAGEQD